MNKKLLVGLGLMAWVAASTAVADKKYDPGATDTEIKIGHTNPYSGPASAYGAIGRAQAAYFKMINEQGGINGRKIVFISVDDAYSPPKTVEQVRKLVSVGFNSGLQGLHLWKQYVLADRPDSHSLCRPALD